MIIVWIKFLICALIIFFAGSKLTKYGDAIGEKTGLCRAWIGIVILAAITSLPELANSISAVTITKIPDLAVGDLLGACMINVFTLAWLDLFLWFRKKESIFIKAGASNLTIVFYGMILLALSAFSIDTINNYFDFNLFNVSIFTISIFLVYLLVQKKLYTQRKEVKIQESKNYEHISMTKTLINFFVLGLIVIAAGSWLPVIGNEIVETMSWGHTFVAVLFLGLATTLPEATVSIMALRLNQVGMSIGNLIGSNVFNLSILFWADLFYRQGSLLGACSYNMFYAAMSGLILMIIVYYALKNKISNHIPSLLIIILYLLSLLFLFRTGAV